LIRGFEPGKLLNSSDAGHAAILNNHMPTFVQELMDPARAAEGFSLDDAVSFVVTIEQLMFDSESARLESVYGAQEKDMRQSIGHDDLHRILEEYMVHLFVGEDNQAVVDELVANMTLVEEGIPHWVAIRDFVEGRIRALDYHRQRFPQGHRGQDLMSGSYSFGEAHEVVGSITKTFASFWQSECETMKSQLVDMDRDGSGRVRIADFYGTGLDKDWRFGESEAYLRELGALDESSSSTPRVIVANYMQAASNCIIATPHYMVCCMNECESLLGEVEAAIGFSSGSPDQILQLVGNMSSPSSADGELPNLKGALTSQLQQIAELHGGKVPLHGRLFSQWLHYVFPLECAFPHKTGTVSYRAVSEHEDGFAKKEDMRVHVESAGTESLSNSTSTEDLWMQWSPEESLSEDYASEMQAPWESRRGYSFRRMGLAILVVIGALVAFIVFGVSISQSDVESECNGAMLKHHLV